MKNKTSGVIYFLGTIDSDCDSDSSLTTEVDGCGLKREADLIAKAANAEDFERLGRLVAGCRDPKNAFQNLKNWFRRKVLGKEEELCEAVETFVTAYMSTGISVRILIL